MPAIGSVVANASPVRDQAPDLTPRFSMPRRAVVELRVSSGVAKLLCSCHAFRMFFRRSRERRMCLCGMLAAGYDTLSEPMQQAVIDFFDANEAWLTRVLEQGQESGRITLNGPAREAAQVIVSGLEGAMLIARPYNDVERFNAAATRLLTGLVS